MKAACALAWHNVHSSASCRNSSNIWATDLEDFRYSLYAYPSFGSVSLPTWWPSTCDESSKVDTWPCEVGPDAGRVHLAESFKFTLAEGDLSHAPLGPIPRAPHSAVGNQEAILLYLEKYENAVQSGGHRDEQDELEAGLKSTFTNALDESRRAVRSDLMNVLADRCYHETLCSKHAC